MNKDEHKDNSICMDFMETHGVFMSGAVLSNLAVTIASELESRMQTKDETNDTIDRLSDATDFMDRVMDVGKEMDNLMDEMKAKRSPF